MRQYKIRSINTGEGGFASIMIALMFILVLSLLTTGFVEFSDREQQDALNSQLASEAQYAADSGINDAEHDLTTGVLNTLSATDLNGRTCITTPTSSLLPASAYSSFSKVSPDGNVEISCLSVNTDPPSLTNSGIEPGTEWYQVFTASGLLDHLDIQWSSADKQNNPTSAGLGANLTDAAWNSAGYAPMLQVSFTPIEDGTNDVSRSTQLSNNLNLYLYPSASGTNSIGYGAGGDYHGASGNGTDLSGHCTSTNGQLNCSSSITGINTGYTGPYLITVTPYYDEASVTIDGSASGAAVNFTGQTQIDVTAKAQNVVKRLLATIPTSDTATPTLPAYSVQASNICKRLSTQPGITSYVPATGAANDPCTLTTN